jgi:phenylacetate-coenzyme A ligase PaaK-like adenylate-forming protein
MTDTSDWLAKIFTELSESDFETLALEAFRFQFQHVQIYRDYCQNLRINLTEVHTIGQIPFLPIGIFKKHEVKVDNRHVETIFTSSGTTGMETSRHFVSDLSIYETGFLKAFERFYDPVGDYCTLALLPSYLERQGSSLVYMAGKLIQWSNHPESGFYLNNYQELATVLEKQSKSGKKTLLLGVTYALLDLAEMYPIELSNTIVMETGGMKGRRREMIREELHQTLCTAFGVASIHSEYGMTELLSQAYSKGDGIFNSPPWMKIMIRDTYDPFQYLLKEKSGGINVIDLANIHSCCFIETQDIGKILPDGSFAILGRFDQSDIRGCNLMVG